MPRELKKRQDLLTKPITVAVLGTGGREHALAKKISESPLCRSVVVLPGNDGMAAAGLKISKAAASADLKEAEGLARQLEEIGAELVVIGPDDLLAAGLVDDLERRGFAVFGPTKAAARIEWSKSFAKELMAKANIPTSPHGILTEPSTERLAELADELGGYPLVLKYDGLALGKGVRVCADRFEAEAFAREVLEGEKFSKPAKGKAKDVPVVIVEQFLTGHEVSLFAVTDGETIVMLEPACDHKRLLEGNAGPNTGGMGAYSPVPWLLPESVKEMGERIFAPLLAELKAEGASFKGLLYAGLMVRGRDFWVLEFNARFGDPETQALLPRMESDLLPLLYGAASQSLERHRDACPLRWTSRSCVNIVLASRGYPEKPETGHVISGLPQGLDRSGASDCERIYFSGVVEKDGVLCNSGGRVLSVSALDENIEGARRRVLAVAANIRFEGVSYRKDIGSVRSNY